MTDVIYKEIQAMRSHPQCPSMTDLLAVFELAVQLDLNNLAEYIFLDTKGFCDFICTGNPFSAKQLEQVQAQLPEGATIQRWYRACEGDLRVIAKLQDEPHDVRYTVSYLIDGYPLITRMD